MTQIRRLLRIPVGQALCEEHRGSHLETAARLPGRDIRAVRGLREASNWHFTFRRRHTDDYKVRILADDKDLIGDDPELMGLPP